MAINIDELLAELEQGAEKTAEESFVSKVAEEDKTAEKTEEVQEVKEEKTAEKTEVATEEKIAEKTEEVKEEQKTEKTAEKAVAEGDKELIKVAMDMGKIAAHSFFAELVALGIMPPTNKDMVVPPVSGVSLPSESPVTLKADAEHQLEAGHDGYDARQHQYKTASVITPEFLTKLHKKLHSEE